VTAPAAPWIFLRGLTRDSRHWGDFPARFAQRIGAAPVLLDLPGNGAYNQQDSPASVAVMAQWCRDELQARGHQPPYQLLAMSLGAMVAVAWAQAWPQELQRAVLINTSLHPYSRFYQRLRPRNYRKLLSLALHWQDAARCEATVLRMTSRHQPRTQAVLPDWVCFREQQAVSRANALRQLLAATRYRAPALKPAPPLLLLASTQDQLVDVRCSRVLAQAWGCALHEHPSAGHDLPLDDGDWLAEQVGRWRQ
jgi:pimeloyl-ACP methyl ester carboxylesterase